MLAMTFDGLLQISVAVTSSSWCVDSDKFKHSPKNVAEHSEPCSTSADTYCSFVSSADSGKLATVSTGDFSVPSSASLGHVISNGFSVIKSGSEVMCSSSSAECHVSQSVSHYSTSSLPSCIQNLHLPVISCTAVSSSPLNPLTRSPAANTQPFAMNWNIRRSPVSALNALCTPQHTAAELFPSRNASLLSTTGYTSPSENSRHRSVKAGSTWFPAELQTSSESSTTRKRNIERSSSVHPYISSGGSVLNSPLKKFVDRHPTRNVSGQNLSYSSSEGVSFSRNGIAAPELTADQPMDLSTQHRKTAQKSDQRQQLNRTHFDTTVSDQPLDLSRSSHSVRPNSQIPRHPVQSSRPSDSGSKLPSGMIDLQNYCSRLLSGGYSLDSRPSTITSSSSFSSLVSKMYFLAYLVNKLLASC